LRFIENSVLSSLDIVSERDFHDRTAPRRYDVTTVIPRQLLLDHDSPPTIDFLSIDTEGSELEILQTFPFDAYDVQAICVEHNFSPSESKIASLLVDLGFVQFAPELSGIDSLWVQEGSPLAAVNV
jgi:hypothetical protein